MDQSGAFYFLEMNTRLQVEHPITEWITGFDLVAEMLRVAAGERLGFAQSDVVRRGASIECRVYAEDAQRGFMPSPGPIHALRVPAGPFVRDDGGVYAGTEVSSYYDPLISKLSVWGVNRQAALARMRRALREYVVTGIKTNLRFHERVLAHPAFIAGDYHTAFIDENKEALLTAVDEPEHAEELAVALALAVARRERREANAPTEAEGTLSPWVAAHRARNLC
jgi:acetyl-CoA carboxylase biotin carboxylase subunit